MTVDERTNEIQQNKYVFAMNNMETKLHFLGYVVFTTRTSKSHGSDIEVIARIELAHRTQVSLYRYCAS